MKWEKLLSQKRLGKDFAEENIRTKARTVFQKDYDRIVFSSAFRRLQNKTQVFPMPKSDYVRNRLTHSLETASVGRSLGNLVGDYIIKKHKRLAESYDFSDFGAIVSAACLAHDIGNPPFGHSGENAISSFFKKQSSKKYFTNLSRTQITDLQNFEGNAAGFRIISNTPNAQSDVPGGLGLTYSTYASFVKYPKGSYPDLKNTKIASLKKFNYFETEKPIYNKIADELQIDKFTIEKGEYHMRYPLAFLVEAADDICYTIIDYEDGFQEGLLSFEEVEEVFAKILEDEWNGLKSKYNTIYDKISKINYLRSRSINTLIYQSSEEFKNNESSIMQGKYNSSLLDNIQATETIKFIKKDSFERIYSSETVLKIEAAGYKVLPELLDIYIEAIFNQDNEQNRRLLKLVPNIYLDKGRKPFANDYENLLNISMYISGMTDKHAVELYRQLNGISLAGY